MLAFITIPNMSDMLSSVADVANPFFQEYWIYMVLCLGIFVGFSLASGVVHWFNEAIHSMFGQKFPDRNLSEAELYLQARQSQIKHDNHYKGY